MTAKIGSRLVTAMSKQFKIGVEQTVLTSTFVTITESRNHKVKSLNEAKCLFCQLSHFL